MSGIDSTTGPSLRSRTAREYSVSVLGRQIGTVSGLANVVNEVIVLRLVTPARYFSNSSSG